MEIQRTELAIPIVPRNGITTLSISLTRILITEQRAEEIAAVTPEKAAELMSAFNRAYLDACEAIAKLKLEEARAEDELAKVRADILIDKAPGIIKAKGLPSSADTRQAIVDTDPDFRAAGERVAQIVAMLEYIKGKMKFFENSYTAVKKIMDTSNWNMERRAASRDLNGYLDEKAPVGGQARRFGNPKE